MWVKRNGSMKNVPRDQYAKVYKGRGYKPVVKMRKAMPAAKPPVKADFTLEHSSDATPKTRNRAQQENHDVIDS